jgi:hypothetical protein
MGKQLRVRLKRNRRKRYIKRKKAELRQKLESRKS